MDKREIQKLFLAVVSFLLVGGLLTPGFVGEGRASGPVSLYPTLEPAKGVEIVFEPDRGELRPGECATLRWAVAAPEGAIEGVYLVKATIEGIEIGRVPSEGQEEACLRTTTSFALVVDVPGTLAERNFTIHVAGLPEERPPEERPPEERPPEERPPEVIHFFAHPESIAPGQCTILEWGVAGPEEMEVFLNGVRVERAGAREECPGETTTYALLAHAATGTVEKSITVQVAGAPPPPPETPPAPPSPGPQPPQPPSPQPPPTPSPNTVDLAVTDLYPDSLPKGEVYVRITNNGPATATNVNVDMKCNELGTPLGTQPPWQGVHPPKTIVVNLSPGQTQAFDTGISIDTSQYSYKVTCGIGQPQGFSDPNVSNNNYSESIAGQVKPLTPVPVQPLTPGPLPNTVDLAVTDLYPDNSPKGEVYVRITNNGPAGLQNASAQISCSADATDYATGAKRSYAKDYATAITLNLNPGQTQAFDTRILIDTSKEWFDFRCSVQVQGFTDPNPNNNTYSEHIPPPP